MALACVRECERQRVGLDRLAALLTGYAYAVENAARLPTEGDALHLVGIIEPTSLGRYRRTPVTFTNGGSAMSHTEVAPGDRQVVRRPWRRDGPRRVRPRVPVDPPVHRRERPDRVRAAQLARARSRQPAGVVTPRISRRRTVNSANR